MIAHIHMLTITLCNTHIRSGLSDAIDRLFQRLDDDIETPRQKAIARPRLPWMNVSTRGDTAYEMIAA